MSESREYTEWREKNHIEPWVKAVQLTDDLKTIRTNIRGKKRRTEIAGQYGYAFDKQDVASLFYATVDYYSNVGLVFRNKDSGEYKRMPICSRWNTKRDDWYKKRYWDIHDSVKDETKVTMLADMGIKTVTCSSCHKPFRPDGFKTCPQCRFRKRKGRQVASMQRRLSTPRRPR